MEEASVTTQPYQTIGATTTRDENAGLVDNPSSRGANSLIDKGKLALRRVRVCTKMESQPGSVAEPLVLGGSCSHSGGDFYSHQRQLNQEERMQKPIEKPRRRFTVVRAEPTPKLPPQRPLAFRERPINPSLVRLTRHLTVIAIVALACALYTY